MQHSGGKMEKLTYAWYGEELGGAVTAEHRKGQIERELCLRRPDQIINEILILYIFFCFWFNLPKVLLNEYNFIFLANYTFPL